MQQSVAQPEEDANEESRSGGRRLVWKARDGTTCVAVFANQGEKSIFHTIKIEHTSKDQASGEYKPSNSLPVSKFANISHRWVPATPRRSSSTRAKASLAADLPIIPI